MKYFTKDYVESLQNIDLYDGFDVIDNKDLINIDYDDLYMKREKEYLDQERDSFDTSPLGMDDMIEELDLKLEDILIADVNDKGNEFNFRNPESMEEYNLYRENYFKMQMNEFNNRELFDEDEAKEEFKSDYEDAISNQVFMPKWVYEEVDPRLIALYYLPRDIYEELQKIDKENKEYLKELERLVEEDLYKQRLPEHFESLLDLHDSNLLKIEEKGNDIYLYVRYENDLDINNPKVLRFVDAKFLEKEEINLEIGSEGISSTYFIYQETYNNEDNYEFHFLLESYNDEVSNSAYMTIKAKDLIQE